MEDLKIKFDGQTHQIEANTLINSLLHFSTIVQEVNKELKTDKKIEVKINALPEGSFLVHFTLETLSVLEKAQKLFSGSAATAVANIIAIVGGIYGIAKFLKGKKPKSIQSDNDKSIIINDDGDTLIIENLTINIYVNNKTIQESLTQEFTTLENDPNVTGFEMLDKNDKPIVHIERKEFAALASSTSYLEASDDKIDKKIAMLNIVRLSFDKSQKWEFYYEGNKIIAKISDGDFIARIDNGESFAKGDSLEVELEVRQEFDETVNTYVNKAYKINEVKRHIPRPPQGMLDFPKRRK